MEISRDMLIDILEAAADSIDNNNSESLRHEIWRLENYDPDAEAEAERV